MNESTQAEVAEIVGLLQTILDDLEDGIVGKKVNLLNRAEVYDAYNRGDVEKRMVNLLLCRVKFFDLQRKALIATDREIRRQVSVLQGMIETTKAALIDKVDIFETAYALQQLMKSKDSDESLPDTQ